MGHQQKAHLPSMAQLLMSGLGLIFLLGSSMSLFIVAVYTAIESNLSVEVVYPFISSSVSSFFFSILTIPSILLAFAHLIERPLPIIQIKKGPSILTYLMVSWPLLLLLGHLASRNRILSLSLLPLLQIFVIIIPIVWFVELGQRGIKKLSHQKNWGLLNFGFIVTPSLVITAELLVLLILAMVGIAWLSAYPGFQDEITRLSQRLMYSQMDPEIVMRIIKPIFQQPITIILGIFVSAGLIPIIEEFFKPLGLWVFAGNSLNPAEGFRAGLICGAVFGMVESLGMVASAPIEGWAGIIVARLGTGLLHIVTTGLMGWGLTTAWNKKGYLQLGVIYLISIFLHGIWNLFGVTLGLFPLIDFVPGNSNLEFFSRLNTIAPLALGILIVTLFLILIGSNRKLRTSNS